MKSIVIDAMGGDFGPPVTVPAAIKVLSSISDVHITLVGIQEEIEGKLNQHKDAPLDRIRIVHTDQVVKMDDPPAVALRKKRQSSMRIALDLVKSDEAKACVSGGNTGALMAVARFVLKTFPGINRPAIIGQLPTIGGRVHMLDLGANVDCSPGDLFQFGIMGSTFVSLMEKKEFPKVVLLNNGTEEIKGSAILKRAVPLFQESDMNFRGFTEGDGIYTGDADVIVCDGMVGNVAIKASEGAWRLIKHCLESEFKKTPIRMLTSALASPSLNGLKRSLDPRNFNGAALLGLRGSVIKSHGSADKKAFETAVRKAVKEVESDIPAQIHSEISIATGRH